MKRIAVLTTVSVLILGLTLSASAQRRKAKPEEPKMKAELKLSDEQKQKLQSIHRQSAKERIRLNAERQIAHIELQELMQADRPDQGAVDRKIDQLAELSRQLTQNRLQGRVASRSVLTKEQWAGLKHKMGQRIGMKHRQHRMRMFRFKGPGRGFGPGMGPGGSAPPMENESLDMETPMPDEMGEVEEFEQFSFLEGPGFDKEVFPFEDEPEFEIEREIDVDFSPVEPADNGWQ
ncbi:MAG: Spy/CpxP family protein refolding chaperone [candidate division Zixibacteria bacterium]|nr:Spy/CpxP family protein refolding chaperone [candidate division Zixibacteria bacterium]MCI0596423.1 Spy/CpxP family protein refolding chaperone [candidate division Zixibacteria bacterium]